ncbi:MAG: PilZ domain-containing protein [Planctomycetota bacterium]
MPAHRSRTSGWRRCLQQVHERRGALDIAVVRDPEHDNGDSRHLIWRVRLVALTKEEILVERPTTLGQVIQLDPGIELVAILAVGQNRWMFSTSNLGLTQHGGRDHRAITAMRLAMPQHVERCQRRNYYRIETATLNLPEVEVWPLLDPKSVIVAERAVELQGNLERGGARGPAGPGPVDDAETTMPEVGPKFAATLLNIGGGGVGLRVRPQDAQALTRHKLFWLRFSLPPELATPICATGKLAHTNVDSTQHTYAGMAFDFSFNPGHQRFVVEQICRYITAMQRRAQLRQSA